jgi:hypothetical protein
MADVVDILNDLCENCKEEIETVFAADPRPIEIIAGDLYVDTCCFVRDEIRFLNNGRLIFTPSPEMDQTYCRIYYVVCRKLTVIGGHKPVVLNPCGPEDPGQAYQNNNVITWLDRLKSAQEGPLPNPFAAGDGTSHDRNSWQNQGQGNNGANGGNGSPGGNGSSGANGRNAPDLVLIALEVEIVGVTSHLTIDFDGQVGGKGGRGQNGGKGGNGMGGRIGDSDTSWPGIGCDRQPGSGGQGGNGGDGGTGGPGGKGGDAGDISIISTLANVTSGPFVMGDISYVNDGGNQGEGGLGGFGGRGGLGGNPGFKTSECDAANSGADGADGFPPPSVGPGSTANQGVAGPAGANAALDFLEIVEHDCTVRIPLEIITNTLNPTEYCRGFSTPANNLDGTLTGQNLSQVATITSNLMGVTVTKKLTSTDTQIDLTIDLLGNSGLGAGDLVFHRDFGGTQTMTGAITVNRFEVTGINPATGARNTQVPVTITGTCFDPSAMIQQVDISGLGVTALNVVVVDSQTVTCTLDIGALAPTDARNVMVKTGVPSHTLLSAFTVTN